jgi:hypothetical protein
MIYQITEKSPTLPLYHQMKQNQHSIVSIPHCLHKQSASELHEIVLGRERGVLDEFNNKIEVFQQVCTDLITHFRVDQSCGILAMKRKPS